MTVDEVSPGWLFRFVTRAPQPPCLKPSSPAGSWMTPSSETFSLMMIFPISVLLRRALSATTDVDTATPGSGPPPAAHFAPWPVSAPGCKCGKVREEGDARVELVAADLISRDRK